MKTTAENGRLLSKACDVARLEHFQRSSFAECSSMLGRNHVIFGSQIDAKLPSAGILAEMRRPLFCLLFCFRLLKYVFPWRERRCIVVRTQAQPRAGHGTSTLRVTARRRRARKPLVRARAKKRLQRARRPGTNHARARPAVSLRFATSAGREGTTADRPSVHFNNADLYPLCIIRLLLPQGSGIVPQAKAEDF